MKPSSLNDLALLHYSDSPVNHSESAHSYKCLPDVSALLSETVVDLLWTTYIGIVTVAMQSGLHIEIGVPSNMVSLLNMDNLYISPYGVPSSVPVSLILENSVTAILNRQHLELSPLDSCYQSALHTMRLIKAHGVLNDIGCLAIYQSQAVCYSELYLRKCYDSILSSSTPIKRKVAICPIPLSY